jgi:hypothetical protein
MLGKGKFTRDLDFHIAPKRERSNHQISINRFYYQRPPFLLSFRHEVLTSIRELLVSFLVWRKAKQLEQVFKVDALLHRLDQYRS